MEASGAKSLLDPRTKITLLIVIAIFVLGGTGGEAMQAFRIVLSALPFVLLLLSGKVKACLGGCAVLMAAFAVQRFLIPVFNGPAVLLLAAVSGIIAGFVPSIMMGRYMVSTTTVSQFIAAMERMHVTEKITIPLSVMFRFFPTVQEEFSAINAAMGMRDIRFSGKKKGKIIEYRMIPMMICCVKIGDELSAAALTRGLGAPVKRTNICRIGFGLLDYVLLALCAAVIIVWILSVLGVVR